MVFSSKLKENIIYANYVDELDEDLECFRTKSMDAKRSIRNFFGRKNILWFSRIYGEKRMTYLMMSEKSNRIMGDY